MSATIEEALRCLTDVGEPITHVQAQLIAAEVERLKAELSMSRENQQASHARWTEVTAELATEREVSEKRLEMEVQARGIQETAEAERDAALALADATQVELNAERERHHATAGRVERLTAALVEVHGHVKVIYSHYSMIEISSAVRSNSGSQLFHYGKAMQVLAETLKEKP